MTHTKRQKLISSTQVRGYNTQFWGEAGGVCTTAILCAAAGDHDVNV